MNNKQSPWSWIPTLYFAEGFPYVLIVTVSVIMFKKLGVSNSDVTLYTGWLYLPWVIKPLWSPFVDLIKTKRWWVTTTQIILGAGLAGIAFSIPTSNFLQWTLAIFWLLAFSSATHDIAADGLYMLGLRSGCDKADNLPNPIVIDPIRRKSVVVILWRVKYNRIWWDL